MSDSGGSDEIGAVRRGQGKADPQRTPPPPLPRCKSMATASSRPDGPKIRTTANSFSSINRVFREGNADLPFPEDGSPETPPPGLLLTPRHHSGGGGVPHHPIPPPPGPPTPSPAPLKYWARFSSGPSADQ